MMRGYYGGGTFSSAVGGFGVIFGILCMLFMIALVVIAVIIIVNLIRRSNNPQRMSQGRYQHSPQQTMPPAIEILNARLAKGEITIEQYNALKDEIMKR